MERNVEFFRRIGRFIYAMVFAINPPPDFHDRLWENMQVLIEQEKIKERWIEIWGRDPAMDEDSSEQ